MCMKYLNTTTNCYKSIQMENDSVISYERPFNGIQAIESNGMFLINGFVIATQINILGTNKEEDKPINIIAQNGSLDFCVRLTKCNRNEEERICTDLEKFTINVQDYKDKIDYTACFPFLNFTRVIKINNIELKGGIGNYVIKVLVKKSEETDQSYTVQSISSLNVFK